MAHFPVRYANGLFFWWCHALARHPRYALARQPRYILARQPRYVLARQPRYALARQTCPSNLAVSRVMHEPVGRVARYCAERSLFTVT